ncbi:MAG: phosphatase PAP2 family protein [Nitrospiraceae bacterium]|nr:phosphatase PAP2 family protein [Nitrospiraceae bacterium]
MDTLIFNVINHSMANPVFDLLMPVLTFQGYLLVLPLLPYIIYRGATTRDDTGRTYLLWAVAPIVIAFLSFPLADSIGDRLKEFAGRPRPCASLDNVRLLVHCPSSFSFPSSHATTSFAAAVPLFVLTRSFLSIVWRLYPVGLAVLIAFSRPYLGVHYPSDIAAGAFLGGGVAYLFCWIFRRFMQQRRASTELS